MDVELILASTTSIVTAYLVKMPISAADLPGLIQSVFDSVRAAAEGETKAEPEPAIEQPSAAEIRKSITPDGLTSFIDGKRYKTLKRHLGTHGLDPYSYRARYGLPADYPMVAASYAAQRSELAKSIGLGRPTANRLAA